MDKYKKSAEEIMKRGDLIIAEKKRRSALIQRTAFTVSGMSAAILVGIGIWNSPALRNAVDIDDPAYSNSEIIPVTSDISAQTVSTENHTTVRATYANGTATTSVESQFTAVPVTTDIPHRTVVPVQSVQTTAATGSPSSTVTTATPETTGKAPVSTSTATVTTRKAPNYEDYPVSTSAVPATTSRIPDTTLSPGTGMAPGTTLSPETGMLPVTTSAVPATTSRIPCTTLPPETGMAPGTTLPPGTEMSPVTTSRIPDTLHPNTSIIPPDELVFGDILYSNSDQLVDAKKIDQYLGSPFHETNIFSIAGVPPEHAVALKFTDEIIYYLYINLNYKAPEATDSEDKRGDTYDEKETCISYYFYERNRRYVRLSAGKRLIRGGFGF